MENTTQKQNTTQYTAQNRLYKNSQEPVTIDLLEVLAALKKRFWLVLLAVLLGVGIAFVYTMLVMTPQYTSSASVLVLPKEQEYTSVSDLQYGTSLTNDYKILINSTAVIQKVNENLNIGSGDYKMRVANEPNTRILLINVQCPDPVKAKSIADEYAKVSSAYIGEKMEVTPPKVIEEGKVPKSPSSPNLFRNLWIGGLIGLAIAVLIVVLQVMLNDTIKTGDDMEKYLGIYLLASVPDRKDYINNSRGKKKRRSKTKRGKGLTAGSR